MKPREMEKNRGEIEKCLQELGNCSVHLRVILGKLSSPPSNGNCQPGKREGGKYKKLKCNSNCKRRGESGDKRGAVAKLTNVKNASSTSMTTLLKAKLTREFSGEKKIAN